MIFGSSRRQQLQKQPTWLRISVLIHLNSDVYILMKIMTIKFIWGSLFCTLPYWVSCLGLFFVFPLRKKYEDLVNNKVFLILSSENWAGYSPITHYSAKIVLLMIAVLSVSSDCEDYNAILHLFERSRI